MRRNMTAGGQAPTAHAHLQRPIAVAGGLLRQRLLQSKHTFIRYGGAEVGKRGYRFESAATGAAREFAGAADHAPGAILALLHERQPPTIAIAVDAVAT